MLHRVMLAGAVALALAGPAGAQTQDPQAMLDQMIRQKQIELDQRFEDRQRQRAADQQEAAWDRRRCIQAGFRGPDVEQCVRDSALYRRGVRPGAGAARPGVECMTMGDGMGGGLTFCD